MFQFCLLPPTLASDLVVPQPPPESVFVCYVPALQLIDAILINPDDKTEVSLIFANNTEDDIILRNHIDNLAKKHSNFKVG